MCFLVHGNWLIVGWFWNGHLLDSDIVEKVMYEIIYRFELLFFDGSVLTGKFCVGVPLNIQSIYINCWLNNTIFKGMFVKKFSRYLA